MLVLSLAFVLVFVLVLVLALVLVFGVRLLCSCLVFSVKCQRIRVSVRV